METLNIITSNTKDVEKAFIKMAMSEEVNKSELISKLSMLIELRVRMTRGEIVEFDYIKKSTGELRHAIGCLYKNLIEPKIKGTGTSKASYGNFAYFDLAKGQFRSFAYENIVKVYSYEEGCNFV